MTRTLIPATRFDGGKLRAFRESRQLSLVDFARKIEKPATRGARRGRGKRGRTTYTPQLVGAVEAGTFRPSVKFLEALSAAYGVDVGDFFSRDSVRRGE